MHRFLSLPLAVILLLMAGCSNDSNTPNTPDQQKDEDKTPPTVSVLSPQANESVGRQLLTVEVKASDNRAVTKVEVYLNAITTPVATLSTPPWKAVINIGGLQDGEHTVHAIAYDAAANVGTSQSVTFRRENVRMTLVEIITSANCPPCAPANEYYKVNIKGVALKSKLATIKNHVWWPYPTDRLWLESQTWSEPRTEYLFYPDPQYVAPAAWVNGSYMGSTPSDWVDKVDAERGRPADAKIQLDATVSGNTATVTIRATGIASGSLSDLKLHTAVLEDNIAYSDGNGETMHYDVMRMMLPNASGEDITLGNGETKTFMRTIALDNRWNRNNLKVVVFLQSDGSKHVLQAGRIPLK